MNTGLVSVVLPVYGVEKYLDRCVESVVKQTYSNLEIILVDDGSKDNCPAMCDVWAARDSRIRVIHKENAGLGEARNTGIRHATGEYICFFDSDDYIDETTIEKACGLASANRADAVIFGFHKVDKTGTVYQSCVPPADDLCFEGLSVQKLFLPDLVAPKNADPRYPRFYMSAWVFLYSMEIIRNSGWQFVSERQIISEDVYSLLGFFSHVKKLCVLPEALYYYCENDASLSRKYHSGRYAKISHFYRESLLLCETLGYDPEVARRLNRPYLGFVLSALKQEVFSGLPAGEIRTNIRQIVDDSLLQKVLYENRWDVMNWKKRLLYWSMRRRLYTLTHFLLRLRA